MVKPEIYALRSSSPFVARLRRPLYSSMVLDPIPLLRFPCGLCVWGREIEPERERKVQSSFD